MYLRSYWFWGCLRKIENLSEYLSWYRVIQFYKMLHLWINKNIDAIGKKWEILLKLLQWSILSPPMYIPVNCWGYSDHSLLFERFCFASSTPLPHCSIKFPLLLSFHFPGSVLSPLPSFFLPGVMALNISSVLWSLLNVYIHSGPFIWMPV